MSLFIGNISKNVKKSDLVDEFDRFGKCDINHKVLAAVPAIILSRPICATLLLCFILLTPLLIGLLRFH